MTFDAGAYDSVVAFYDDWTSSEGDEDQRTDDGAGGVGWTRTSGSPDDVRIIAVLTPLEGDDRGLVTLTDGTTG